jgi:hypothetical protein
MLLAFSRLFLQKGEGARRAEEGRLDPCAIALAIRFNSCSYHRSVTLAGPVADAGFCDWVGILDEAVVAGEPG